MSVRYRVWHETHYVYPDTVPHALSEARVQPRDTPWQRRRWGRVLLRPEAEDRRERVDPFGNPVLFFSVQEPHMEATVLSEFEVELFPECRPDSGASSMRWADMADWLEANRHTAEGLEARPWTFASPAVPRVDVIVEAARERFGEDASLLGACGRWMEWIHTTFRYDGAATLVDTPVLEAFETGAGVCQDFAHIMLCGLRGLGLPARYVSGYLETLPPPGEEKLVGADATHAWVSVFDPSAGWIDFDPTNNLLPSDQHITLGWGRDFTDVIPVKGVVMGGDRQEIEVRVDVEKEKSDTNL